MSDHTEDEIFTLKHAKDLVMKIKTVERRTK